MKNIYIKFIAFYSILLCNAVAVAQETPGSENSGSNLETVDTPAANINDFTIPMLLFGGLLSIYLIKKKIKA